MEFLRQHQKPKILRTRLYGDQEFTRFELELLHTPILQRLYDLKQLGFTDRIFPDAVHARFNHIIGVTEVVDRMVGRLHVWLGAHSTDTFVYAVEEATRDNHLTASVTGVELAALLATRKPAIRLMALLHDITHAAFGHTLEDEVNVFDEKHDAPARQQRFFDGLVAQLLYLWCTEERLHTFDGAVMDRLARLELSDEGREEKRWAEELAELLGNDERRVLAELMRHLELAFRLLLRLDSMHDGAAHGPNAAIERALLASEVAVRLDATVAHHDLVHHRDMFMIDLVGNTICADLLDYARRDPDNAGLRVQFDDRFLRYLGVVSVAGDLSPTGRPCIRTAIQIFTDKMRQDVLSEMSGILKARYLINERVLFHPTKCAAGAMLGTSVQLLGLRDLPRWMQVLGDQQFLLTLTRIADNVEHFCSAAPTLSVLGNSPSWESLVEGLWPAEPQMAALVTQIVRWIVPGAEAHLTKDQISDVLTRGQSARNLLWRLQSRRFPKLAYRLRTAHHTAGDTDQTIAKKYSTSVERYRLERRIEQTCRLPMGAVVVHCPTRTTSLKVAEVLVVGRNLEVAARLRDVTTVSEEGLEPYQREIRAVEDMYESIWQLHAFLDSTHWSKQPIVAWAFEQAIGFPNDELLSVELASEPTSLYHPLVSELKDEIAPKWLPAIVERVDHLFATRMRLGRDEDPVGRLRGIIREVQAQAGVESDQLALPGIDDTE